jgi:FAD/FMN-containing dehydrogenase
VPCNRTAGAGPCVSDHAFTNWAQNVTVTPQWICYPTSIDELVGIVKEAEGEGVSVRAADGGWSFTDVMLTPHYLVCTDKLNSLLSGTAQSQPDLSYLAPLLLGG